MQFAQRPCWYQEKEDKNICFESVITSDFSRVFYNWEQFRYCIAESIFYQCNGAVESYQMDIQVLYRYMDIPRNVLQNSGEILWSVDHKFCCLRSLPCKHVIHWKREKTRAIIPLGKISDGSLIGHVPIGSRELAGWDSKIFEDQRITEFHR